ncbi:hypothetical protein [Roseofilum casamattae]|uniref:Uncharacterized protein n=1 Tax=Roseofilum casamattae BLCC-M143 TaxID=3022442 RepID=A0ABT7C2W5_9CYAN|nr:hypothetical protein [Roseofilum casamattae]MDJ1185630.1 hypothetical protein [Roseofilum casamattae BLCC-M143]
MAGQGDRDQMLHLSLMTDVLHETIRIRERSQEDYNRKWRSRSHLSLI